MQWLKNLNAAVRFNEPLSGRTTLGVGGTADIWAEPADTGALREVVCGCRGKGLRYLVIGRGSNILFTDRGFKGAVICLTSPVFSGINVNAPYLTCGGGVFLSAVIKQAQASGLSGLEFLAGIPASAAGALVMNAGALPQGLGNCVERVRVMDEEGRDRWLEKAELKFGYRCSNLNRFIVLEMVLKLVKRNPQAIQKNIKVFLDRKRKKQDLTAKSAGCVFKNPDYPLTAGEMIDACGLKGLGRGGAGISAKHANFIINRNRATSEEILYLIELAREAVKKKFGVLLDLEIKIMR